MCKVIFNLSVAAEECEKAESGKSSSFPAAHHKGGSAWWRSWSASLILLELPSGTDDQTLLKSKNDITDPPQAPPTQQRKEPSVLPLKK